MTDETARLTAVLGNRYAVEARIGSGATADVYRAIDRKHGRPVAIKVLRPEVGAFMGSERFIREIETAARLQHPNILPVYDSGEVESVLYYTMPFVEGNSLRARLVASGALPLEDVLELVREVSDALAFAHRCNVVHRDIKPENILMLAGHAVVADFGIARVIQAVSEEKLTLAGLGLGTPEYMSPEQAFGEGEIDGRSDIYSLGCVTYELLTGRPPFTGGTPMAVLMQKTTQAAPSLATFAHLADAPGDLGEVLEKAMAGEPGDRFATAVEFSRALREATASGSPPAARQPARSTTASIAVLPFANVSGDAQNDYLSDGVSDELTHALGKVAGLHVVARTSAFAFKGSGQDVRAIGERLRVQTLLDGTMRRAANRVRITAQLVDAKTGFEIWSERYDRELTDVFAVQDDITHSIVEALKIQLLHPGTKLVKASTDNLMAYERFLEARFEWNRRTETGMHKSLALLERAIELDPTFAAAFAAIAESYVTIAIYGQSAPGEAMPRARDAAERALKLDAGQAEALAARACVAAMYDWNWTGAEADFKRAIAANPQSPTGFQWYAMNLLVPLGRFAEAREQLEQARELDPLSGVVALSWALAHYFERDYDRAIAAYLDLLRREPGFGIAHFFLGQTYVAARDPGKAASHLERAIDFAGESPEILATFGVAKAEAGDASAAREALAALEARARKSYVSPVLLAQLHAALGDTNAALDALEAGHAVRATDLVWIGVRPAFDSFRLDPRFARLARDIGVAPAEAAAG